MTKLVRSASQIHLRTSSGHSVRRASQVCGSSFSSSPFWRMYMLCCPDNPIKLIRQNHLSPLNCSGVVCGAHANPFQSGFQCGTWRGIACWNKGEFLWICCVTLKQESLRDIQHGNLRLACRWGWHVARHFNDIATARSVSVREIIARIACLKWRKPSWRSHSCQCWVSGFSASVTCPPRPHPCQVICAGLFCSGFSSLFVWATQKSPFLSTCSLTHFDTQPPWIKISISATWNPMKNHVTETNYPLYLE